MKKIVATVIVLIICLLFSACDFNISSVDTLMRPPKLSGENRLLQTAFEDSVGNSNSVIMKTPISGDYRSSYLFFNLDDGDKEALVFYSDPANDTFAYVSIFKIVNDEWNFVSTIKGRGEEIYDIRFADINGDSCYEIVISWTSIIDGEKNTVDLGATNKRIMTIYSYNGSSATLIKADEFTKIYVQDLNNDNSDDLLIFNIDFLKEDKKTKGRIVRFDKDYSIIQDNEFTMTSMINILNIMKDEISVNGTVYTRLFIDGSVNETGIITEVICIDNNTFDISLPFYSSNLTDMPKTLRDVNTYSQDIDNDGYIEIPTVENLLYGERISGDFNEKSSLNLTVWSEVSESELVVDFKCLLNGAYGYMLVFPDEWIGKYTAVYNSNNEVLTVYLVNETGTLINELFYIKVFSELQWDENHYDYSKLDAHGAFVYGYYVKDINSDTFEELIKNFIIIGQE